MLMTSWIIFSSFFHFSYLYLLRSSPRVSGLFILDPALLSRIWLTLYIQPAEISILTAQWIQCDGPVKQTESLHSKHYKKYLLSWMRISAGFPLIANPTQKAVIGFRLLVCSVLVKLKRLLFGLGVWSHRTLIGSGAFAKIRSVSILITWKSTNE